MGEKESEEAGEVSLQEVQQVVRACVRACLGQRPLLNCACEDTSINSCQKVKSVTIAEGKLRSFLQKL